MSDINASEENVESPSTYGNTGRLQEEGEEKKKSHK